MTHKRALLGGVERGTNERHGIWSCDLWANERPKKKLHGEGTDIQTDRQTDGHCDSMTGSAQWADSVTLSPVKASDDFKHGVGQSVNAIAYCKIYNVNKLKKKLTIKFNLFTRI